MTLLGWIVSLLTAVKDAPYGPPLPPQPWVGAKGRGSKRGKIEKKGEIKEEGCRGGE